MNTSLLKDNVQMWLRDHNIKGFYTVSQARSFAEGSRNCITMAGLGKLAPNLLVMGFKSDWKETGPIKAAASSMTTAEYIGTILCAFEQNLSVAILRVRRVATLGGKRGESTVKSCYLGRQEGEYSQSCLFCGILRGKRWKRGGGEVKRAQSGLPLLWHL